MAKNDKATVIPLGATTKMRIRTFTPEGLQSNDRLVEMVTELAKGPTEVHEGPISLEVTLYSQEDVGAFSKYLQQLAGVLPIEPKVKKIKKHKDDEMLGDKNPVEDLIAEAKSKETQEELMDYLRELNFRFVSSDTLIDHNITKPGQFEMREKHQEYQWMIRLVKEAKDPVNDQYDFRVVFGIKIVGDKINKVQVYCLGQYEKTWTKEWSKPKDFNFKKVTPMYSFPEVMDYNERRKWRAENRKVLKDPAYQPSKMYLKYKPYVKVHGGGQ